MNMHVLYAVVLVALAVVAWRLGGNLLWIPFLAFAGYQTYRSLTPVPRVAALGGSAYPEGAPVGELGRFEVDGDDSFGLFLKLADDLVFVDIREDRQLEERKKRAVDLVNNSYELEKSLAAFRTRNLEFANRRIAYIGLHSSNVLQGEVFWEPTGYTLLQGFEFVNA